MLYFEKWVNNGYIFGSGGNNGCIFGSGEITAIFWEVGK